MRLPAVAGIFYPADEDSLYHEIRDCFLHSMGPGLPEKVGDERRIIGAVAPHAGYKASGMNAAHTYKSIREDGLPEAYVIIGPDHYGIPYRAALCSEPYITPFGQCKVHKEITERLKEMVQDDPESHILEHSIEVQVPFIQYIDSDPHIVPIIMRDQDKASAEALGRAVRKACDGFDVIVMASSDLSHYIKKTEATELDGMFLKAVVKKDVDLMYKVVNDNNMSACGYGPIASAIYASGPSSIELLKHSDSQDSLGPSSSGVVGYASLVMKR